MIETLSMEHISPFSLRFKKKSEKALLTEISKLTNEVEKKLQDENISKIKQLEIENENLKLRVDNFVELAPTLVAKDEFQQLLDENLNLKEQLSSCQMENSSLNAVIEEMKLNEIALVGQLGKLKKAERIPCSICKKLCNSERSLQRHIIDKHSHNNDF